MNVRIPSRASSGFFFSSSVALSLALAACSGGNGGSSNGTDSGGGGEEDSSVSETSLPGNDGGDASMTDGTTSTDSEAADTGPANHDSGSDGGTADSGSVDGAVDGGHPTQVLVTTVGSLAADAGGPIAVTINQGTAIGEGALNGGTPSLLYDVHQDSSNTQTVSASNPFTATGHVPDTAAGFCEYPDSGPPTRV